ncbi:MAG TPA: PUA domain-containing protein [Nitrososphaerales archaeon]|nr:PUA domain-containing protein [Nitrososphaerales archaeon]
MKKWVLSRRDSTEMISGIETSLGLSMNLSKSAQAQCAEPEEGVVFVVLEGFEFVQSGGGFFPFLGSAATLGLFPSAVVDEGAIKFLLNGADVMRPGIRKLDDWGGSGRMVIVKEEKKGRAIAVGTSMVSSAEAQGMSKGGCIRNLHHVGDRFWNLHKSL